MRISSYSKTPPEQIRPRRNLWLRNLTRVWQLPAKLKAICGKNTGRLHNVIYMSFSSSWTDKLCSHFRAWQPIQNYFYFGGGGLNPFDVLAHMTNQIESSHAKRWVKGETKGSRRYIGSDESRDTILLSIEINFSRTLRVTFKMFLTQIEWAILTRFCHFWEIFCLFSLPGWVVGGGWDQGLSLIFANCRLVKPVETLSWLRVIALTNKLDLNCHIAI